MVPGARQPTIPVITGINKRTPHRCGNRRPFGMNRATGGLRHPRPTRSSIVHSTGAQRFSLIGAVEREFGQVAQAMHVAAAGSASSRSAPMAAPHRSHTP